MLIGRQNDAKPARRQGRPRGWKQWAAPVVLISLCAAIGALREDGWNAAEQSNVLVSRRQTPSASPVESRKPRLVYPYSVVPGGIEESGEITGILGRDPVVEEHYRGFQTSRARTVVLDEPRMVYVSYRVKDTIYWTRNRVQLKKGEKIITDGKELIRARCGNRISDAPMAPIALTDPPEVSADTPLLPQPLVALAKPGGPPSEPLEQRPAEPAPVPVPEPKPGPTPSTAYGVPFIVPIGGVGGGVPPTVVPPSGLTAPPAGTQPPGGAPPSNPPVTPPAPSAEPPPTTPPPAPPATVPPSPPGGGPTPSNPPPSPPPGGPGAPPSNPPSPSAPPSRPPSPPVPSTPPVTPPSPDQPSAVPPSPVPPGPIEPPLPGAPPRPNGITPPGPNPLLPPGVDPPPSTPQTPPEPPPVTPIPEPSTYALIGAGLAAMAWLKSRRKRG